MATWTFDPAHSTASFAVKHMMVTTVRGAFKTITGNAQYDPANPDNSSVTAEIQAASIDTGVADRDNHLRSADFFDAANFPLLTFKSTSVRHVGEDRAKITGDLTIRGVTREVTFESEFLGIQTDPFSGAQKAGFVAETKINREDWGLVWNMALEAGGVLVGKEVKITLDIEAVKLAETEAVTATA